MTDEHPSYPRAINESPLFGDFRGKHRTVNHSAGVYVNGPVHTNTVENAFSLLKRGLMGFKWSPTRGAWVRFLIGSGRAAGQVVKTQLSALYPQTP